jgi:hypothetical protein
MVVGRIMKAAAAPVGTRWTLAFGYHEDRTPTHGCEPTREDAHGRLRQELAAEVGCMARAGHARAFLDPCDRSW